MEHGVVPEDRNKFGPFGGLKKSIFDVLNLIEWDGSGHGHPSQGTLVFSPQNEQGKISGEDLGRSGLVLQGEAIYAIKNFYKNSTWGVILAQNWWLTGATGLFLLSFFHAIVHNSLQTQNFC